MAKLFDKKFLNVILLGFAFMFVFTAFQTCGMIQKVVISSMTKQYPGFSGDGYLSLAIIYAVFSISNWFAPSVISSIGPKYSMFVGGITYCLFIMNFLFHVTWGLYLGSALIGFGASIIWTGQGTFLTMNSDCETMSRNSGVFWALLQCSLLFGNLFVYIEFAGKPEIDEPTRLTVFGVLLTVCGLGLILILCLSGGGKPAAASFDLEPQTRKSSEPIQALVKAYQLMRTREMIFLSITFFYTGLELSFFSGVYGSCLGFTKRLGEDSAKFVGISGMFIGVGEILGGAVFGLLGKKTNKYGRDPVVLLGYIVHMVTFFLIFISFPANSPISDTYDRSYIKSSLYLAMFCAFGLGFGDACFNTQIYSLLGCVYSENSAPAYALFKFFQSIAAAIAFTYSTTLLLPYQLLILVVLGTLGAWTFWVVEWEIFVDSVTAGKESVESQERKSL